MLRGDRGTTLAHFRGLCPHVTALGIGALRGDAVNRLISAWSRRLNYLEH